MSAPGRGRMTATLAYLLAAVVAVADALVVALAVAASTGEPRGVLVSATGVAWAATELLAAPLVVRLSGSVTGSGPARAFVRLVVVASALNAANAMALTFGVLPPVPSLATFAAVVLLRAAWLVWLSRRHLVDAGVPQRIGALGLFIGVGTWLGLLVAAAGFLLPWLSVPQRVVFGAGAVVGGGAWLAWPLWYALVGRYASTAVPSADAGRALAPDGDQSRGGGDRRSGRWPTSEA